MRVQENIEAAGYFWLPPTPDRRVPGTLYITESGKIELEIVGLLDAKDDTAEGFNKKFNSNDNGIERIVGQVEKYGMVTLEECHYSRRNFAALFGNLARSVVFVNQAYLGANFGEQKNILFKSLQFSADNIDDWVGISGIKMIFNPYPPNTITYEAPESITHKLSNGMELMIVFKTNMASPSLYTEVKITQKAYFRLKSEQGRPITEFTTVAYKLIALLCFAYGKAVSIEQVIATSDSFCSNVGEDKEKPDRIELYYQSNPYSKEPPITNRDKMLFCYPQIRENAEQIFNRWLDAYDSFDSALNLYVATTAGAYEYLSGQFLALAQSIETYHRRTSNDTLMSEEEYMLLTETLIKLCPEQYLDWLHRKIDHGNELPLNQRLKKIIEPFKQYFGNNKERDRLTMLITNTRNYYTHYDEKLKTRTAMGVQLWMLYNKLEVIFQLHILQVLGFTNDEIETIFNNNLKRKLNYS